MQLVPAATATFVWDTDDRSRVTQVEVRSGPLSQDDFENSAGAIGLGWMEGDPRLRPAGIFAWMLADGGFDGRDGLASALRAFGQVEECQWARDMLAALARGKGPQP